MSTTTSLRHRIAAAVLTAGVIGIGALALDAPTANAATFKQLCEQSPGSYAAGAVRGVWGFERRGNDRHQSCTTYDASGKKLGVYWTYPDYGWFIKHPDIGQVTPPPVQK